MSEEISRLLEAQCGVASGQELQRAGFSRRTVEVMVRRGELVRVRRDAVVLASALAGVTPWDRRTLLARAVGRSLAPAGTVASSADVAPLTHALSHESALMVHGLPYFGEDGLVHLVRTDGRRGRRDGTVWVHRPVDESWTVEVDGLRLMKPTMAALQVAATHGAEAGLVALDQGGGSASSLARLVAELADGRSESVGESRSRWLVRLLGLGPCTPQFEVRDGGLLVGVADLKLDRWDVLIEFDGTGKYTGHESLLAEKDREDRIRALGYEVVRIRWADLSRPHLVRRRLFEAISRAEARWARTG